MPPIFVNIDRDQLRRAGGGHAELALVRKLHREGMARRGEPVVYRISLNHANPASLNAPDGQQLANPAARVIDPVLTTAARGYRHPMHVHRELFPAVPVMQRGGNVILFDRTDFRRVNARRAPGADTSRVQFGHEGRKFSLTQHRLEGQLPLETGEEAASVGVDMGMRTVDGTQALISLEKEVDAATTATAAASYQAAHVMTPGANDRWNADGASPTRQIIEGAEVIRAATGMRPNLVVLGPKVYAAARIHPTVLQQIRYAEGKQIATKEDLAKLWDIERVAVGEAISVDEKDVASDVWGNHVVLAYTRVGPVSRYEPSFAFGYQLAGTPLVEEPYFERRPHSWFYPVCDEYSQEIVGQDAGYLIRNAIV